MTDISKQGFKILDKLINIQEKLLALSSKDYKDVDKLKNATLKISSKLDLLREEYEYFLEELTEEDVFSDTSSYESGSTDLDFKEYSIEDY